MGSESGMKEHANCSGTCSRTCSCSRTRTEQEHKKFAKKICVFFHPWSKVEIGDNNDDINQQK